VLEKTALLQAEALARVLGFANVLFCGVAVSFFLFSHCKITTVVSFLGLLVTCLYPSFFQGNSPKFGCITLIHILFYFQKYNFN